MDDIPCSVFRMEYPIKTFVSKTPQKVALGRILKMLAGGEVSKNGKIDEALKLSNISYKRTSDTQSNLAAGMASREVTWAFYYRFHLNIPGDPALNEIDRALLGGKTFEEHYKRPVRAHPQVNYVDRNRNDPTEPVFTAVSEMPAEIEGFFGRQDQIATLHEMLTAPDATANPDQDRRLGRAAIHGLPGVGKTSLAVEYVRRNGRYYGGIWWCLAEARTGLTAGLGKLVEHLGIKEDDAEKAAKVAIARLANAAPPHLLIYDNIVKPDDIRDFLPRSGARVLITSQASDWGSWAEALELDVFELDDATKFIQQRANRFDDPAGARSLAEVLGQLPLALDHAGAFCRSSISFSEYAAQVRLLIAKLPSSGTHYGKPVKATFELAIKRAVEEWPAAEQLIAYLGHCAPDAIPDILIKGAIENDIERLSALQALGNVSLIRLHSNNPSVASTWSVHRLVQEVARHRSEKNSSAIVGHVGLRLGQVFPADAYTDVDCWPVCLSLMPHVWPVYDHKVSDQSIEKQLSQIFHAAGVYMLGRGMREPSEKLLYRALKIRERPGNTDLRGLAKTMCAVALYLHTYETMSKSKRLCIQALQIQKDKLGMSDIDTLITLNNLAYLYMDMGQLKTAHIKFAQALRYTKKYLSNQPLEVATSLDNLSLCCQKMDRLDEARTYCEEGLALRIRERSDDHPDVACSLENLGLIEKSQGRLEEAIDAFEKAERIAISFYGEDTIGSADSRMGLAEIYLIQGKIDKAHEKFEGAFRVIELAYESGHDEVARCLEKYALMLRGKGLDSKATPFLERAVTIYRGNNGNDPLTQSGVRSSFDSIVVRQASSKLMLCIGMGDLPCRRFRCYARWTGVTLIWPYLKCAVIQNVLPLLSTDHIGLP